MKKVIYKDTYILVFSKILRKRGTSLRYEPVEFIPGFSNYKDARKFIHQTLRNDKNYRTFRFKIKTEIIKSNVNCMTFIKRNDKINGSTNLLDDNLPF